MRNIGWTQRHRAGQSFSSFCKRPQILNWSCPKDATWVAFNNNLKCSNLSQLYLLLKSSDFVVHDLTSPSLIARTGMNMILGLDWHEGSEVSGHWAPCPHWGSSAPCRPLPWRQCPAPPLSRCASSSLMRQDIQKGTKFKTKTISGPGCVFWISTDRNAVQCRALSLSPSKSRLRRNILWINSFHTFRSTFIFYKYQRWGNYY